MIRNEEWSTMRRLLFMRGAAGGSLKEYEAEGNPAVFHTNVAKPLSAFTIPFLPVQQGTGDPSPSNVRPISGWSGATAWRTGINVFDASANPRRDGYLLNDNGVEQSSGSSGYTNGHISVIPGKKYTISGSIATGSGTWRIYNFDRNKEFIGRTSTLSSYIIPYTYTIPEDCYYIAIQYQTSAADLSTIQIELGETASPYAEYTGQSYPVTFPATGKNLLNPAYRFGAGSTIRYYQSNSQEDRLHLKAGQTYVFSASVTVAQLTLYENVNTVIATAYSRPLVYTPTEDKYVWVEFFFTNSAIPEDGLSAINCQGEKGETATAYEPYTNTVYGGTLDAVNGVLTVEWAKVDLGTLTYSIDKVLTGVDRFVHTFTDYGGAYFTNVPDMVCETFKPENIVNANQNFMTWVVCVISGNATYFYTPEGTYEDAQEFKEAMNGVMLCYKLATPYEIQLDPLTIATLKGDNTIWTDTNGSNTIKYKKKG